MSLVRHLDGFRRIWMFPRNIRRISPWKMSQILSLIMQHARYGEWSGNQSLQNAFCNGLEAAGLKREGEQYDPHSGGPRTYLAQLKCLGLIFQRDDELLLTKAGEDLAEGVPPLPIMQSMLLRHQYPSIYGQLQNVKINPDMKVKPFLFVLKLLNNPRVKHLTNEELAVPVIFGHNNDCLNLCVRKISQLRSGASLLNILENRESDLYLPRGSHGNVMSNILDIANTAKNYLQACCLINVETADGENTITFAEEMRDVYESALRIEDDFIPVQSEESFQRAYGAWDRIKDTRSLVHKTTVRVVTAEESIILAQFYSLCGTQIISSVPESFIDQMQSSFGIDRNKVLDTIQPHIAQALDFFESTFLELSRSGTSGALGFEKAITNLFNEKLYFKAKHTGQMRRAGEVGGYSDVFAVALDNKHCAIIDAKASPSYSLPASDYHAMLGNYIPNYRELTDGMDLELEFCSYVAGGFRGDIASKLKHLQSKSRIGCSAIRARDLLHLAKKNVHSAKQPHIRAVFRNGGILEQSDFD